MMAWIAYLSGMVVGAFSLLAVLSIFPKDDGYPIEDSPSQDGP